MEILFFLPKRKTESQKSWEAENRRMPDSNQHSPQNLGLSGRPPQEPESPHPLGVLRCKPGLHRPPRFPPRCASSPPAPTQPPAGRAQHSPSALSRVRRKSSERPSRNARHRERQRKSSIQPAATASASATGPESSSSSGTPICTCHSRSSWHSNCSWSSLGVSAIPSSGDSASSPSPRPRGLGPSTAAFSAMFNHSRGSAPPGAERRLACAGGPWACPNGSLPQVGNHQSHCQDGRPTWALLLIGRGLSRLWKLNSPPRWGRALWVNWTTTDRATSEVRK